MGSFRNRGRLPLHLARTCQPNPRRRRGCPPDAARPQDGRTVGRTASAPGPPWDNGGLSVSASVASGPPDGRPVAGVGRRSVGPAHHHCVVSSNRSVVHAEPLSALRLRGLSVRWAPFASRTRRPSHVRGWCGRSSVAQRDGHRFCFRIIQVLRYSTRLSETCVRYGPSCPPMGPRGRSKERHGTADAVAVPLDLNLRPASAGVRVICG